MRINAYLCSTFSGTKLRAHYEEAANRQAVSKAKRDHGGSISRKQLTEILVKKFENRCQTISGFISQWIKDKLLFEMNAVISDSDKMYFGL